MATAHWHLNAEVEAVRRDIANAVPTHHRRDRKQHSLFLAQTLLAAVLAPDAPVASARRTFSNLRVFERKRAHTYTLTYAHIHIHTYTHI